MKKYSLITVIGLITLFSAFSYASYNTLSISEVKTLIIEEAEQQQVSPALALAIAKVESDFNPLALSSAGARGVMQIMPATAENVFGVSRERLFHAQTNIKLGLEFIKQLLAKYDQRLDIALSHYNGGSGVKGENGHLYVIPSTQAYVNKVLAYYRQFDIKPYYSPFHNQHLARTKEYPYKVGEVHNITAPSETLSADEQATNNRNNQQATNSQAGTFNASNRQASTEQGIAIKGPRENKNTATLVSQAQLAQVLQNRNINQALHTNAAYNTITNPVRVSPYPQAHAQNRQVNTVVSWQDAQSVKPVIQVRKQQRNQRSASNRYIDESSRHENTIVANYLQQKSSHERTNQVREWESIFK